MSTPGLGPAGVARTVLPTDAGQPGPAGRPGRSPMRFPADGLPGA